MENRYEKASQILSNLKLSSDNVEMAECYYLCASKQLIEQLRVKDHQIIWGRRGTGKTTIQKAFAYDINYLQQDPSTIAIYVVMASSVPTMEEIGEITGDGSSLAVYVFSKLIYSICKELEKIYTVRAGAMDDCSEESFLKSYYALQDYITTYQTYIHGGELSINNLKSNEIRQEIGRESTVGVKIPANILDICVNFFRKHSNATNYKQSFSVSGKIKFRLETQIISEHFAKMLDALGVSLMYICIDEFSEIDKISEYTIQSKVAQLIKQVFFKNPRYSVKISAVWNLSKLHTRGGTRVEGIEYQQDIFAGPDLDIMFMENNADVTNYFKELLVNTYLMAEERSADEKEALSEYLVTEIFGEVGLRHLICGSQGISRAFVILAKAYLQRFIKDKNGQVKLRVVYEIIKHQYLEDVRNKIPYYSLYNAIEQFITDHLCRYFLITREDYHRCKTLINYLSSRGLFIQLPGHLTDRRLRNNYKLFIIHYGSYLDALENESHKSGRKRLDEDSKLELNGMLVPEYNENFIREPELYTVKIPQNAEKEIYCTNCGKIFVSESTDGRVRCVYCNHELLRFAEPLEDGS